MKIEKWIYLIVGIAILIRIPLLFLNPITMWTDPSFRYLPNTYDVLEGDFSFYTPPLLMVINAFPTIFLSGFFLEFAWKLIPFIFFLLSTFVFLKILKTIELKNFGKILLLCLFFFSVYSVLLSTSVMLEMPTLFFSLVLFYIFEKNEKVDLKLFFIIAIITALLLYSKQTGYFILAGFFLYIFFKKMDKKQKRLILMALILGLLFNVPWIVKNNLVYGNVLSAGYGEDNLQNQENLISFKNPFLLISDIFHATYKIPSADKLNYSGILFILSKIYYFSFVLLGVILTFTVIAGIIKFGNRYKRYLLIVLPLFILVCFFAFLYYMHYTHDFGRYMFSFYFIFFFFGLKYVENLKNKRIKNLFYLSIILFCIFSLITSYAMSYEFHKKDVEIRNVNEFIKDKQGVFISNDHYTKHALIFYSGKEILSLEDSEKILGEKEYSSNKYEIYVENSIYYIYLK